RLRLTMFQHIRRARPHGAEAAVSGRNVYVETIGIRQTSCRHDNRRNEPDMQAIVGPIYRAGYARCVQIVDWNSRQLPADPHPSRARVPGRAARTGNMPTTRTRVSDVLRLPGTGTAVTERQGGDHGQASTGSNDL